jgi:hypothetical protein
MKNLKSNLMQLAHLSGAITVGICIAYIDLSVKILAVVAGFTALLYIAHSLVEQREFHNSQNPVAEQAAKATGFDLSSLDNLDR